MATSLRELEERVDAHSPGPWSYRRNGDALYLDRGTFGIAAAMYHEDTEAEFALIVRMRNALGEAMHGDLYREEPVS